MNQGVEGFGEVRRGGRRHHLAVRAVDLAGGGLVAAVEAGDRRDRDVLLRERPLDERVEDVERTPPLAGAGADADGDRGVAGEPQLRRERNRGDVMAGW